MPEEELNLFQLAPRLMAQASACSSEIMRSEHSKAAVQSRVADN
jgi:hypothetical protein